MVDVIAQRSLSRRSSITILAQDELVLVEPAPAPMKATKAMRT
jgi:hypothetical protein